MLAKALIDKIDISVDFAKSFMKCILKKEINIEDMYDIDPIEAQNL